MRTNTWFDTLEAEEQDLDRDASFDTEDDGAVTRIDLMGYYHPREIVADMALTVSRRRELLAFWLSDFNAVRGAPALRRSGSGVTTTVAELRAALAQLDEMADFIPGSGDSSSRLGA